jgi:hypothetical protein
LEIAILDDGCRQREQLRVSLTAIDRVSVGRREPIHRKISAGTSFTSEQIAPSISSTRSGARCSTRSLPLGHRPSADRRETLAEGTQYLITRVASLAMALTISAATCSSEIRAGISEEGITQFVFLGLSQCPFLRRDAGLQFTAGLAEIIAAANNHRLKMVLIA